MELEALLKEIVERNRPLTDKGVVAHYIPELDKARKDALGIVIKAVNGKEYYYGDCIVHPE